MKVYGIRDPILALFFLGILLLLAKLGEETFERARIVPYVGAVLVGIIIGPGVLGLISVLPNISLFISIGINFLLFTGGALEFKGLETKAFTNVRNICIGLLEFLIPFVLIAFAVFELFKNLEIAMIAGIIVGMSSAGPLSRLLTDTGLNKTEDGNRIFEQVVLIEIIAVVAFSFFSDLSGKIVTIALVLEITSELIVVLAIILIFSKYVMPKILEHADSFSRSREGVIAIMFAFLLILGFFGELYGFNSAIVALFLGIILRDFISDRPIMAEKITTLTYGFFEPLFFVGLGLYFVRFTPTLILSGIAVFLIALVAKPLAGLAGARITNIKNANNAFGTAVKGGVDAALLIVALDAALVSPYFYSVLMIAIILMTVTVPLLFNLRNPVVNTRKENYVREIINAEIKNLKACDISEQVKPVYVRENEPISVAFNICNEMNARGLVVINESNKVVGVLHLSEMIQMKGNRLRTIKVKDAYLSRANRVKCNAPARDIIRIFMDFDPPIVAVIDENSEFKGTILEREILRYISTAIL